MSEPSDEKAEGGEDLKRTKHRSPNHPAFGLVQAIKRLETFFENFKRASVPVNLAHEKWDYRAHGGAGNQAVAALKAFGLLDVEGDGKGRKVKVSDAAYRILQKSSDSQDLLKKAALSPAIHSELFHKYAKDGFFQRDLIRQYLVLDREEGTFNSEVVDGFIEDFRSSLEYAGLLDGDKLNAPAAIPEPTVPSSTEATMTAVVPPPSPDRMANFTKSLPRPGRVQQSNLALDDEAEDWQGNAVVLRYPLARGNVIEIRLKSLVTKKEFERIKKLIDLSELSFLADGEDEE